jgi:hypothetical protein
MAEEAAMAVPEVAGTALAGSEVAVLEVAGTAMAGPEVAVAMAEAA